MSKHRLGMHFQKKGFSKPFPRPHVIPEIGNGIQVSILYGTTIAAQFEEQYAFACFSGATFFRSHSLNFEEANASPLLMDNFNNLNKELQARKKIEKCAKAACRL